MHKSVTGTIEYWCYIFNDNICIHFSHFLAGDVNVQIKVIIVSNRPHDVPGCKFSFTSLLNISSNGLRRTFFMSTTLFLNDLTKRQFVQVLHIHLIGLSLKSFYVKVGCLPCMLRGNSNRGKNNQQCLKTHHYCILLQLKRLRCVCYHWFVGIRPSITCPLFPTKIVVYRWENSKETKKKQVLSHLFLVYELSKVIQSIADSASVYSVGAGNRL